MALVYLPEKVWSTRYGPDYFTVAVIGYKIHENAFAQYELQVQNGKRNWTLLRRFSEFDRLRWNVRYKGGDRMPNLPPKTFCCRDLNPDFLSVRKTQLEKFLHDLLVIPGITDDIAVREFLLLQSSKTLFV
uniref:PX domain-containing protein n=1 Tax=Globisporangium ultimum (strain ATCC 200006 / CBS 805.95 / DAOM BR144) TaxID=431595 RepID=K3X0A5_GLOUD